MHTYYRYDHFDNISECIFIVLLYCNILGTVTAYF